MVSLSHQGCRTKVAALGLSLLLTLVSLSHAVYGTDMGKSGTRDDSPGNFDRLQDIRDDRVRRRPFEFGLGTKSKAVTQYRHRDIANIVGSREIASANRSQGL